MPSSPTSLTGRSLTGLDSIGYGARRQYIDACRYWHHTLKGAGIDKCRIDPERRPFPAPKIFFHRESNVTVDKLFIIDFTEYNVKLCNLIKKRQRSGLEVAVVHWPRLKPDLTGTFNAKVREMIADLALRVVVPGEKIASGPLDCLRWRTAAGAA